MKDLGAEPALDTDAKEVVLSAEAVEYIKLLNVKIREEILSSLPEQKKDMITPVKKRQYKPRDSQQVTALKKECNKFKSKAKQYTSLVQEKQKQLRTVQYSARVTVILARIEKDEKLLKKILEMMKKNKIQIDESQERQCSTLSTKIDKIKNNINEINEEVAEKKDLLNHKIKKWERKEGLARAEMEKINEKNSIMLDVAKEKAKQNIQAAKQREADEIDKINREIQNQKDAEDREETTIKQNIEAKKNTLAKKKHQFDQNIKRMNEEQAKTIAGIDAEIQNLKDDESKMKEEKDCCIATSRKTLDKFKKKIGEEKHAIDTEIQKVKELEAVEKRKIENEKEKWLNSLNMAKDKYYKEMVQLAARNRKIEADIKYLKEEKARKENEMKKGFELLSNNKQELEESIKAIQQDEAKKLGGIKAEIKTLQEKETLVKFNLDAKIKHLQNELAVTTQETKRKINAMELQAVATENEFKMRIQNMKEKEKEIEKNIEDREKTLEEHVAQQEIDIAKKIQAMQKLKGEKTEEYDAIMKNMQEIKVQMKKYNIERSIAALHTNFTLDE